MKSLAWWVLVLSLTAGPACAQSAAPLDKAERLAVVTRAGELLATQYIYPDRGAQAKAKLSEALAAGAYDGIDDPAAFAHRLTDDLRAVTHDKHIFVAYEGVSVPAAAAPPLPPPPNNGGFVRVDRLKGNIGYIKLDSFPMMPIFAPAADAAMRDLAGTDALIIDMRDNGGGSAESDSYFGSFFFDPKQPVQLNSIIHRTPDTDSFTTVEFWTRPVASPYLNKPVTILTSARTFSGGEAFIYDLKARHRAVIYGEVTGGGANPGGGRVLNPRFGMFVPNGRAENPVTKTNWEGTGVAPDKPMEAGLAFTAALRDLASRRGLTDVKARLAEEYQIDDLVEAHLLKIRTTPLPNSQAAVRRNIEDLMAGAPHYELMAKDLADTTRIELPRLQDMLGKLGPIKSVTFRNIGPGGLDVYDVAMANGSVQSGIFVEPDGKIEAVWIHPAAPN